MKLLILDNYDSFTYNLVHIVRKLGYKNLDVVRNDKLSVSDVAAYDKILLSPGPGIPSEAGILMDLIKTYAPQKSIFGVCLGHQAIGEAFGATLFNMQRVVHGKSVNTKLVGKDYIFDEVPENFKSGRYHSWAVNKEGLPAHLEITALDENGVVMALKHKNLDIHGVQFHPESIMTEHGEKILYNWLRGEV